jgi:hypothetical protein
VNAPRTPRPALIAAAVLLALLLLVGLLGPEVSRALPPTPTPASLQARATPLVEATATPDVVVLPPPGPNVGVPVGGRMVRLKRNVLVHTAPNAESPRPAISLLGAGMVARVVDQRDDWVMIQYGPLSGWTLAENVEPPD